MTTNTCSEFYPWCHAHVLEVVSPSSYYDMNHQIMTLKQRCHMTWVGHRNRVDTLPHVDKLPLLPPTMPCTMMLQRDHLPPQLTQVIPKPEHAGYILQRQAVQDGKRPLLALFSLQCITR